MAADGRKSCRQHGNIVGKAYEHQHVRYAVERQDEIGERSEQNAAHLHRRAGIKRAIVGGDEVAGERNLPHGAFQNRPEPLLDAPGLALLFVSIPRQKDLADLHIIHARPPLGGRAGIARLKSYGDASTSRQLFVRKAAALSIAPASLKSSSVRPPAS